MPELIASNKQKLKLFVDVEKVDGRILRYHIEPVAICPSCNSNNTIEYGDDWHRKCQNCSYIFYLIEEIKNNKEVL